MYSTISRISGKQSGVAFSGYRGGVICLLALETNKGNGTQRQKMHVLKSTGDNISLTNGSEIPLEEAGRFIEETQC